MLKNKLFASLAIVSLFMVNFSSQEASASSKSKNDNDTVVSMDLVKETMKPQLISKTYQNQQIAQYRANKLKEIQLEQARMDKEAKAQNEAKKQDQINSSQNKTQQPVSQAPTHSDINSNNSTSTNFSENKGTFKLSFYDPSALGSSLGYGGVAANLSIFPKGTKLKITLPDGTVWYKVVNDTGGFATSNPHQLDVAMPNDQVPAAGVLYATVEVVK